MGFLPFFLKEEKHNYRDAAENKCKNPQNLSAE